MIHRRAAEIAEKTGRWKMGEARNTHDKVFCGFAAKFLSLLNPQLCGESCGLLSTALRRNAQ